VDCRLLFAVEGVRCLRLRATGGRLIDAAIAWMQLTLELQASANTRSSLPCTFGGALVHGPQLASMRVVPSQAGDGMEGLSNLARRFDS
jgi:hypothetical protein